MQAPLLGSDIAFRPWRTATVVAGLIAVVEFVALVVLGAMLLAKPLSHAVLRQAEAAASAPTKKATVKAAKVVKGTPAVPKHLGAVKPKVARAHVGIEVRRGIPDSPVEQIQFRIVAAREPHVAAGVLPRISCP